MSFRVQYGNERYVVCDDEAQRSTDVSGAPSRVQMSGTARVQAKAKPLRETVQIRPPQPKRKPSIRMVFLFGTMCSLRERDAHCVRDASFGRDVRFRA